MLFYQWILFGDCILKFIWIVKQTELCECRYDTSSSAFNSLAARWMCFMNSQRSWFVCLSASTSFCDALPKSQTGRCPWHAIQWISTPNPVISSLYPIGRKVKRFPSTRCACCWWNRLCDLCLYKAQPPHSAIFFLGTITGEIGPRINASVLWCQPNTGHKSWRLGRIRLGIGLPTAVPSLPLISFSCWTVWDFIRGVFSWFTYDGLYGALLVLRKPRRLPWGDCTWYG